MADGFPARHCYCHPDLTVSGAGKLAGHEPGLVLVLDDHLGHPSVDHQARLVLDKECVAALAVAVVAPLADAAAAPRIPDAVPSAA